MPDGEILNENHGCIVCGRLYTLQVAYDAEGQMLSCVAASPEVRVLPDPDRPLVVCISHSGSQVGAALAERFFGPREHDHEPHGEDEA